MSQQQPNPPKRGLIVEDDSVVAGEDEQGRPVIAPKTSDGKADESVKPTDPRERHQ
jgi:hypothetical protein